MDIQTTPLALLKDPSLLKTAALVNGQWLDGSSRFDVNDPATGLKLADVANLGPADAEAAIAAANAAWGPWKTKTAKERSAILRKWFDLLMAHQDDLARIMTAEQGKPFPEAKGEVAYGASFVEWFAEEAKRTYGDVMPAPTPDKRILTLKQPIGVVAAITPWNFPVAMITRKVAPALAAGCTVVLKPSEETPLCALALAELAEQAGLPAGVLNIVPTTHSAAVGEVLLVALLYATAPFIVATKLAHVPSLGTITLSLLAVGVAYLPFALLTQHEVPTIRSGVSLAALGIFCTALAFLGFSGMM